MKRLTQSVFAFFLFFSTHAQTDCTLQLSGRVVDAHDGTPLAFADIFIEGTSKGTISGESGRYQLAGICPGTYVIVCAHLGCEPIRDTVVLNASKKLNFFPEHHSEELAEVQIAEVRRVISNSNAMSTIKAEEVTTATTLGEAVERAPGVSSFKTGTSIAKPVIHGLHSNRLLVINNGVRQEGQQWGAEHAPEIDPSIAGDLRIIKGASSVQYGPDAIGGVVVVDPAPLPDASGMRGSVDLLGQSNGLGGSARAMLEGSPKRLPAFGWRAQGSIKKLGDQTAPDYMLTNTGVEEANFSLAAGLRNERRGVEVFYSQFNSNLGILAASHIGNLSDLERAFEAQQPLIERPFSYTINRPYQHVEHELFKSNGFIDIGQGRLNVSYARQYNLREEYDAHRGSDPSLPGLQFEIVTHSGDAWWEGLTWNNHVLKIGASGIAQANTFEGRYFIPAFRKWTAGAYAIDRWIVSGDWVVEAGARIDYVLQRMFLPNEARLDRRDHEYVQPSFNVGTSYWIRDHLQWKANLGTAWRPPNASELYSNGLHHGAASFEIGDSTMLQEVSYTASTSMGYDYKRWKFETEAFVNYMPNFIYLAPTLKPTLTIRGAFPTFHYQQTEALLYGFDLMAEYAVLKFLSVASTTSILRARNLSIDDWLVQIPADQSALALRFKHDWKKVDLEASPEVQWVNKQWRVPPSSDYVAPPIAYWLTNFSLTLSTQGRRQTRIQFKLNNLMNTQYRSYMNRYRYFSDEVGRNIIFSVTQKF